MNEKCKWGEKPPHLSNSSAWECMYKIPLSLVAEVGGVSYSKLRINECLCTPESCRCWEGPEMRLPKFVAFRPPCRYQGSRGSLIVCTKFEDPHFGGPCDNKCKRSVLPEIEQVDEKDDS